MIKIQNVEASNQKKVSNNRSSHSTDTNRSGKYVLEDRTLLFAQRVRAFTKRLPCILENIEDIKQLVRSSGSVGSNYIEAKESLKKDFLFRINRIQGKPILYTFG